MADYKDRHDGVQAPMQALPNPVAPLVTPSLVNIPVFSDGPEWTTGLCGCTDNAASCCEAFFCTPCQMGYQYGYVEQGRPYCSGHGCLLSLLCPQIAAADIRGKIRRAFAIEGNCCNDCMAGLCCTPCVIAQNYRESSLRGHWVGGVLLCSPYVRYRRVAHLPSPFLVPAKPFIVAQPRMGYVADPAPALAPQLDAPMYPFGRSEATEQNASTPLLNAKTL